MPRPPLRPAVHKFGGAAVADAAAMQRVARIVADRLEPPPVVVASALYGVTDTLVRVNAATGVPRRAAAAEVVARHLALLDDLALSAQVRAQLGDAVDDAGRVLALDVGPDAVLALGERLSARILAEVLRAAGVAARYVDATELIAARGPVGNASPDLPATEAAARAGLGPILRSGVVPVVPGFIARGPSGEVTTMGRGGSDLTATLLGRALRARSVTLWKDVPGMLTADPRVVPEARLIPALDPREASELAYHGAKVLHPRALIALGRGTPLHIRPFADPEAAGTKVAPSRTASPRHPVRALSAIEGQALVTLAGNGMVGVPGIAARAFGALEHEKISVMLISQASSEHSICLGVRGEQAEAAAGALRSAFAQEIARGEIDGIEVRPGMATLAIVGLGMAGTPGVAGRLFTALADASVNVVAIAQGSSELNISVVIDARDCAEAQRAIHRAFQLDRIGGGSAERRRHTDLVLLGFGTVGRAVARHARGAGSQRGLRVVAVVDRSGYVLDPRGISPGRLAAMATAKRDGSPLAAVRGGVAAAPDQALHAIGAHALSRPVLVDLTADDTTDLLAVGMEHGMDLVLANKRPLADGDRAAGLAAAARAGGRRLLHEATVGAGLPVIDTLHKLMEAGDQVLRIEGCPSGTLGYLFGELSRGVPFSVALRQAMERGYTEPDPRDDLSGADVGRKALILGRMIGYAGDSASVGVRSLIPERMARLALDEFLASAHQLDAAWARRTERAAAEGKVVRYRATITPRRIRVGPVAVPVGSPLGSLTGTDNQFAITTQRYRSSPLVIQGAGAGAAVTAAGVLNDVLSLADIR